MKRKNKRNQMKLYPKNQVISFRVTLAFKEPEEVMFSQADIHISRILLNGGVTECGLIHFNFECLMNMWVMKKTLHWEFSCSG